LTSTDLEGLQSALGVRLPQEYVGALLEYPLPRDPHSTDMWLLDDPAELRELNDGWRKMGRPAELIVIGGDGGEESYVLDTRTGPYPVLVYALEADELMPYASSFQEFLERQHDEFRNIELDRQRMADAYANKRWWQFWIRPYPPGGAA
jgi:hypothetical protein